MVICGSPNRWLSSIFAATILYKLVFMEKLQSNLFFPLAGIAAVTSLASCSNKQRPAEQLPLNIVYIMTDDHTAQMMSCYDTRYMETPNLDRIAADGVRFTQSFVANSLSGPSRACMITGKHSCANKFYDNTTCVFDSSQQTFPKLLQKIGYQTALVGKWHLESLPSGFDYWQIVPGQGDYYNPDFITQNNDTIQKHGYITNLITAAARFSFVSPIPANSLNHIFACSFSLSAVFKNNADICS